MALIKVDCRQAGKIILTAPIVLNGTKSQVAVEFFIAEGKLGIVADYTQEALSELHKKAQSLRDVTNERKRGDEWQM